MQNRTAELHHAIEAMLDVFEHFGDRATEEVGHFSQHALRLVVSGCDPTESYLELRGMFQNHMQSIKDESAACYESALARMSTFERALIG